MTMSASEYVDRQELSCLVGWNAKCTAFLENNLAVNHKVNHTLNIQSNNPTWKYLPKWNDNPYSYKNWTQMCTDTLFIPNTKNNKMSFNLGIDKKIDTFSSGILLNSKKKQTTKIHKMLMNLKCILKSQTQKQNH